MKTINDKILSWASDLAENAQRQVENISTLPFVFKHVAVMPDAHLGKGACVGTVVATDGAIIPSCVGVDIGCGMIAVETVLYAKDLPDNLEGIRKGIERRIPLGAGGSHQKPRQIPLEDLDSPYATESLRGKIGRQFGTLGSGNHFVEVCLDEEDRVWLMLHSGSRGPGNMLASRHIENAKGLMKQYFIDLPDPDLAYFVQHTQEFESYIRDLKWAQEYARCNREEMMDQAVKELAYTYYGVIDPIPSIELSRVNCHHNFTQMENHFGKNIWVTRKGAIQARVGQLGIIPGSMGTKSYIIRGRGNPLSFNSCSHGAGRRFSRNEARKRLSMADFDREMSGVECRRSEALIDELPSAYKDIDQVMKDQEDLVEVVATLKQIVSVKGD